MYPRRFPVEPRRMTPPLADSYEQPESIKLASGESYTGPKGYIENIAMSTAIRNPIPWHDRSHGERIDPRKNPLISPPPNVAAVAVYSADRDRFDHPDQLRIPGKWEKRMVLPLLGPDTFTGWVPSDPLRPSVLVGLDENGKVARMGRAWRPPIVRAGPISPTPATTTAASGPNGYHYCNGCHTGHTFTVVDPTERTEKSGLETFLGKK